MLIDCEKCSTRYVLDDALIPAQGAAVQCTRCGHVFTARVQQAEPPRAASAPGSSTMMFGTPASAPPSKNQTMMFGAGGAPPPPPPASAAAPNKNQTMMFGTAASNAAEQSGSSAAPNPKQTMVFGASPVPPPAAPAANKNQTMMFGTAASNAAAAAPPPPAAPPPSAKQTMVFGASPVAAPPPNKNQTMMFGTPASNAAPPPAAPPPPSGNAARTTIMFGGAAPAPAPAAPAPAAPPSARSTMVFGTGAAAPPPAAAKPAPARPTFGTDASNSLNDLPADETIMESPGQSSRTLMFGTPTADEPNAPAKNTTMMFGRAPNIPKITTGDAQLAGMSADEGAPNERTVRVDNPELEGGETNDDAPVAPARQDRTQRFAMADMGGAAGPTPPDGRQQVQDRHNRTQLFAMSTSNEATAPAGDALDDAQSRATLDLNSTLPPDQPLPLLAHDLHDNNEPAGVSLLHDPANQTPPEAHAAPHEGLIATTMPNLASVQSQRVLPPLNVEMQSEPLGSPSDFARPLAQTGNAAQEDEAAMRAARGGGAGRLVVIVLALVALVLLGVLIYRLFGDQIMAIISPAQPVGQLLERAVDALV